MKTAIIAITPGGQLLAQRIAEGIEESFVLPCAKGVAQVVQKSWHEYDGFIFIMASGIVVRSIAPLLGDKTKDPCVVVCDESGQHAISLLSGHLGGGNVLANQVADVTGGQAVITTASDVLGHTAVDLWARDHSLVAENRNDLTKLSSTLISKGRLRVFSDIELDNLPDDFSLVEDASDADLVISPKIFGDEVKAQFLRPQSLTVGIGCNRGATRKRIHEALTATLEQNDLSYLSVSMLASIDLKADEKGLLDFAAETGLGLQFYTKYELNTVPGVLPSQTVYKATGAYGVSEPAALLASGGGKLLVKKTKWKDVTIAIAEKNL